MWDVSPDRAEIIASLDTGQVEISLKPLLSCATRKVAIFFEYVGIEEGRFWGGEGL